MQSITFRAFTTSVLSTLLVLACGQQQEEFDNNRSESGSSSATNVTSERNSREFAYIPVTVAESQDSAIGLYDGFFLAANATSYSISLAGCASGFTSTATEASTNLQVYKYDKTCLAKLTQFAINGITYSATATGATNFTTWAANDTATFANTVSSTDTVGVKVVAQLANPISGTEAVTYLFYDIEKGSDNSGLSQAVVGAGHTMTVSGQAAPSFTINAVRYVGMTAGGAGQFEFSLECSVILTNTNTTCKDVTLTDIDYKLVEDTYTSTLTLANANTIFGTAGTSVAAGERVVVGGTDADSNTLTKGGYYTNNTTPLDGPVTIHAKPNMIFIMRAGSSYQYFNVDVTILTQN